MGVFFFCTVDVSQNFYVTVSTRHVVGVTVPKPITAYHYACTGQDARQGLQAIITLLASWLCLRFIVNNQVTDTYP